MKKIEAVILPSKLNAIRAQLQCRGIHTALTLTEVQQTSGYTSGEAGFDDSLKDRLKVELIVGDRQAQKVMDVITRYAEVAANRGAGHVTVLGVNQTLRIVAPLSKS
jgi:nitrogen regulatory protein PII